MSGSIFLETLRRRWRGMVYWGLGLAFLGYVRIVIVPDVDVLKQFAEVMQNMPAFMVQAIGADDMSYMATPEGYLSVSFLSFILVVLAIYSVIAGLNITANEEDRGILDFVLSLPLPRSRLVLEKLLAYALLSTGVVSFMLAGLWLGTVSAPAVAIEPIKLINGTVALLPGMLAVLAFTTLAGAVFPQKGTATAVAAGFVAVSYFVDFIGRGARESFLFDLRLASIFAYYDAAETLRYGIHWGNFALLAALALVLSALAIVAFQRRDIGV